MRFKQKYNGECTKLPEIGDVRVDRRFLWLPLKLGDETRWLEFAAIYQRYEETMELAQYGLECEDWVDVRWRD